MEAIKNIPIFKEKCIKVAIFLLPLTPDLKDDDGKTAFDWV